MGILHCDKKNRGQREGEERYTQTESPAGFNPPAFHCPTGESDETPGTKHTRYKTFWIRPNAKIIPPTCDVISPLHKFISAAVMLIFVVKNHKNLPKLYLGFKIHKSL